MLTGMGLYDEMVDNFFAASHAFHRVVSTLMGKELKEGYAEALEEFHRHVVDKLWRNARGGSK